MSEGKLGKGSVLFCMQDTVVVLKSAVVILIFETCSDVDFAGFSLRQEKLKFERLAGLDV